MNKIYKTTIEDNEIIDVIIDELSEVQFKKLINRSIIFKHKCGITPNSKVTIHMDTIRSIAKDLYKSNVQFKKIVVELWNKHSAEIKKTRVGKKNLKQLIEKNLELKKRIDLLEYVVLCWNDESEEINELGDKGFELYKSIREENNEKNEEEKKEESKMDKNFMDLSIGEVLKIIEENENNNESLKKELEEKEKENKKLKESLLNAVDNKDLRKEISAIKNTLKSFDKLVNDKEQELKKEIDELKKNASEITSLLVQMNKKIDLDYTARKIIEKQKESNNTLKGGIVDILDKKIISLISSMEDKVMKEIKELKSITPSNSSSEAPKAVIENQVPKKVIKESQLRDYEGREEKEKDFDEMVDNYNFFD